MVIKMNDYHDCLMTRAGGRVAYEDIMAKMNAEPGVTVFDFTGVDCVTNSFADEVFGRMTYEMGFDELRKRTTFRNIPSFWAHVIRSAIDAREKDRNAVPA